MNWCENCDQYGLDANNEYDCSNCPYYCKKHQIWMEPVIENGEIMDYICKDCESEING